MAITIRDADLKRDRDELIRFLYENLTERPNALRFDWLYLQSPCGQARAWMALDEISGRTVGVAAAFPRWIWFYGKRRRAWLLGDFCVAPESRSLGPAILLQRTCLAALADDEDPIYDFPSQAMMAVYRRLGVRTVGHQVRYSKLMRVDKKVRGLIDQRFLAQGISAVGNLALRFQHLPHFSPPDVEVRLHENAFGEEFTALDSRTMGVYPIRGLRTAEYLNWRYFQNPLGRYCVVTARREAELLGYAVVEVRETDWVLVDLQVTEESNIVSGILAHVGRMLRTSGADRISAPIMDGSPLASHLQGAGFHPRECHPVVACIGKTVSFPFVQNTGNWFLMNGDRDS